VLKNNDFIVFSDDWGRTPSSTQHLFSVLSHFNRVFWFNTIGLRFPQIRWYDFKRLLEKMASWLKASREEKKNIFVFNPLMFPVFSPFFFRKINKKILLIYIKRVKKKYKIDAPVFFTTLPTVCDLVKEVGERKSVYFCVDEYCKWPGVHKADIKAMEHELLEKVDFLFCSCKELVELKEKEGFSGILMTHGVDVKLFRSNDRKNNKGVKSLTQKLSPPKIGFIGSLDHRIDFSLVEFLCLKKPEWSFIFGGRDVSLPKSLKCLHNFSYAGNIKYNKLPKYLETFDVYLMPYKKENTYIAPLKFKEVILSGKPIVSSVIPNSVEYTPFLKLAREREDFIRLIGEAIHAKPPKHSENLFSNETWEKKAETFSSIIDGQLHV